MMSGSNHRQHSRHLKAYVEKHAEKEALTAYSFPASRVYTQCIVIPAYKEKPDFITRLQNTFFELNSPCRLLLILVLNRPDITSTENDAPTNLHMQDEQALHRFIENTATHFYSEKNLNAYTLNTSIIPVDILVVDRYSQNERIPAKEGVGLARKIGCDISIALTKKGIIHSDFIYSTDADAVLPRNYFLSKKSFAPNTSALIFDFNHVPDDSLSAKLDTHQTHASDKPPHNLTENSTDVFAGTKHIDESTQLYEQAIKYFRDQLIWAGSPYGFNTLGSTLAISIEHYCKVRGFPKRAAAEDFYLLNKLAKVGCINYNPEVNIQIQSRISDRVPFGTGPAVKDICHKLDQGESYVYYHPESFKRLNEFLLCIQNNEPISHLDQAIKSALFTLDFDKFLEHATKQCKTHIQYIKAFHDWFDGFRTLKFIRYLQEHAYPAIPLEDCLELRNRTHT